MGDYLFPADQLNRSIEERKSYFENFIVRHKFLIEAVTKTVNLITSRVPERLIFVCGPTGVGKKVFIKELKDKLLKLNGQTMIENPGCIPVFDVEATAPLKGSFDFPLFCEKALRNLNEPMINCKISYGEKKGYDSNGQVITFSCTRRASLPDVLHSTLLNRGVKAFIIDEAHHMLRLASGKNISDSVDLLKSLTNCSQVPVVLVGTYELLTYIDGLDSAITDQNIRRSSIVHFPRYRQYSDSSNSKNIREETLMFGNIVKMLLLNMPLEKTAENLLDESWEYFYTFSLGCIGILKIWLMDAYSIALEEKSVTLTREHLEKARGEKRKYSQLYNEIKKGESRIERQSESDIESELGFIKQKSDSENNTKTKKKGNPKPFERNPKRDVVDIG